MFVTVDGRAPTAPAAPTGPLAPVRKTAAGIYRTTDGRWEIFRDNHGPVPWTATYRATGQHIYRPTLRDGQAAIASGEALAELAQLDAAALAQPCKGCGAAATLLTDTTAGAQPVCTGCAPRLTAANRSVRPPVEAPAAARCGVCGGPSDGGPECAACHRRHDHHVNRATDL